MNVSEIVTCVINTLKKSFAKAHQRKAQSFLCEYFRCDEYFSWKKGIVRAHERKAKLFDVFKIVACVVNTFADFFAKST